MTKRTANNSIALISQSDILLDDIQLYMAQFVAIHPTLKASVDDTILSLQKQGIICALPHVILHTYSREIQKRMMKQARSKKVAVTR